MGGVTEGLWIAIAVIAVLLLIALVVGLVRYRRRRISLSAPDATKQVDRSGGYTASSGITFSQSAPAQPVERIDTSGLPAVGDDATIPRDAPKRPIADVRLPEPPVREAPPPVAPPDLEEDLGDLKDLEDLEDLQTPPVPDVPAAPVE
jgi:fused signal recognition particle receptor